jgi:hypothetical protein
MPRARRADAAHQAPPRIRLCRSAVGAPSRGKRRQPLRGWVIPSGGGLYSTALTIASTTFLASPNTIIVLSM